MKISKGWVGSVCTLILTTPRTCNLEEGMSVQPSLIPQIVDLPRLHEIPPPYRPRITSWNIAGYVNILWFCDGMANHNSNWIWVCSITKIARAICDISRSWIPGIFMPCVCVMHCRRRFFFGKNDVPEIFMPCVYGFSCIFMDFHDFFKGGIVS